LDPEGLNGEFSIAEFKAAFPIDQLKTVRTIVFCGDIGDPIYATDFLEIVEYIKTFSSTDLTIVTNGSYKKTEWWQELAKWLTNYDTVIFSVDGWDHDSNNLYRINSNWDSIINGIKSLRAASNCRISWSTIYFRFNELNMDRIRNLAIELGCDEFTTVCSSKFDGRYSVDGVDPLKPVDADHTSGAQYLKETLTLGRRRRVHPIKSQKTHEWARCLNWQKELFVNVDGLVFPCPWFNSGYQENDFVQKYRDRINIKTRTLNEILQDSLWEELYTRFQVAPLDVCKLKCRNAQ
jgi:MoaA/NifB/PqqE/SkfB family radical SAM enzyme